MWNRLICVFIGDLRELGEAGPVLTFRKCRSRPRSQAAAAGAAARRRCGAVVQGARRVAYASAVEIAMRMSRRPRTNAQATIRSGRGPIHSAGVRAGGGARRASAERLRRAVGAAGDDLRRRPFGAAVPPSPSARSTRARCRRPRSSRAAAVPGVSWALDDREARGARRARARPPRPYRAARAGRAGRSTRRRRGCARRPRAGRRASSEGWKRGAGASSTVGAARHPGEQLVPAPVGDAVLVLLVEQGRDEARGWRALA